jgi:hypothetical protein
VRLVNHKERIQIFPHECKTYILILPSFSLSSRMSHPAERSRRLSSRSSVCSRENRVSDSTHRADINPTSFALFLDTEALQRRKTRMDHSRSSPAHFPHQMATPMQNRALNPVSGYHQDRIEWSTRIVRGSRERARNRVPFKRSLPRKRSPSNPY